MALSPKQLRAVEMLVLTSMQKQEIAKELGVSGATISQWLKKPEFEEAIKNEMYRAFAQDAIKARRKMSELINSKNDGIALAASREVLNKAGYIETQKVETTVKEINIEITE